MVKEAISAHDEKLCIIFFPPEVKETGSADIDMVLVKDVFDFWVKTACFQLIPLSNVGTMSDCTRPTQQFVILLKTKFLKDFVKFKNISQLY